MPTIPRLFLDRVAESADSRAWSSFVDGAWRDFTWRDYEQKARALGLGLVGAGLKRGDAVAILGETCGEWAASDVGAIGVGGVTVGLYPTLAPEGVGSMHYVLDHSEARFLLVESTATLRAKIAPILARLPRLERIVVWRCDDEARALDPARRVARRHPRPRRSAPREPTLGVARRLPGGAARRRGPPHLHLGHDGAAEGGDDHAPQRRRPDGAIAQVLPWAGGDGGLSFLPMAHAAERCVGHYNRIRIGAPTHYARAIETLLEDLAVARPVHFGSVPRIFEKVHAGVRGEIAKLEPPMRAMAERVYAAGLAAARARQRGEAVDPETQAMAAIFDQQIGARVRARFGGRCTRLVSGAAPIALEILELFDACGIPTYELYGMTETAGLLTANGPGAVRFGTVGRALPGVELRIADDGEILARGDNIFPGYFRDEAATRECLKEGWLHTGDIGKLDDAGFLVITDRKKNILITAGGKNITPTNVEAEVKRDAFVSYCHLHADRRPYPTALVCVEPERLRAFAVEKGLPGTTAAELRHHPALRERVQAAVDEANARLARFEQIRRFEILPRSSRWRAAS